jgi:hypothetical protein
MTQKTKLEILGPYTPEHEGPWVRVVGGIEKCDVHSVFGGVAFISVPSEEEAFTCPATQVCNAREVPEVREFWVNVYVDGEMQVFEKFDDAHDDMEWRYKARTIHVREVLPGEGA